MFMNNQSNYFTIVNAQSQCCHHFLFCTFE